MDIENLKMQSLSPWNKRTGRYGAANNLVSSTTIKPKKGKLGIFEAVEENGTVFAPSQCLHLNVVMGMENLKMQSLSPCNKRTVRYGPANNPVSCTEESPKNGNLGIFEAVEDNGTALAPRECFHQKVAMGMENLKMQFLSSWNKRLGRQGPANNTVSCIA